MDGKNAKRRRGDNFTPQDKELLVERIMEKVEIVEMKKSDAVAAKEKQQAWIDIATNFNNSASIRRTPASLKMCWKNLKRKYHKVFAHMNAANEGGNKSDIDPLLYRVKEVLSSDLLKTSHDNASRIEKSTCENSQSSQLISNVALERNEKICTQNRALFDNSFEIRTSILEGYRLKSSKLFRSYSLFEIDRISNRSFYSNPLRSSLSVPNICQFAENLHSKAITSELKKKDSSNGNLSTLNVNLPAKESGKGYISEESNTDTPESEKNKEKIYSETSNMEVNAQLPISIPNSKDQVKNNETNTGILSENKVVSPNHASNSPNKESAMLTNSNNCQNGISRVSIKTANTTVYVNLCGKSMDIVIENRLSNQEESETGSKVMKSGSSNSYGMNEPVLDSSEKIHSNADITKENKKGETNVNLEAPAKANKIFDHTSESNISKELSPLNTSLVSSKEPAVKISCNSNLSKVILENDQHIIPTDVSDKPFADTLSVKHELESKSRSKKQRKQGSEERSLKKAGDICYSDENIKTMLNIMKQFI